MRYIPCGSAPLSAKVTSFIRCVMGCQVSKAHDLHTVGPLCTDSRLLTYTRIIRTVSFVPTKSSLIKLTRLIRTPVNTDNGRFSEPQVTYSRTLSTAFYGHFICALSYFHCHNHVLIVEIPVQIMKDFIKAVA